MEDASHLLPGLELLAVEAVEQEGEEEVEHHEVAHHQGGQEDGEAGLGDTLQGNFLYVSYYTSTFSFHVSLTSSCLSILALLFHERKRA